MNVLALSPGGGGSWSQRTREESGRDKSGSDWKLEWSGNWPQQIYLNCARAIRSTLLHPPPQDSAGLQGSVLPFKLKGGDISASKILWISGVGARACLPFNGMTAATPGTARCSNSALRVQLCKQSDAHTPTQTSSRYTGTRVCTYTHTQTHTRMTVGAAHIAFLKSKQSSFSVKTDVSVILMMK